MTTDLGFFSPAVIAEPDDDTIQDMKVIEPGSGLLDGAESQQVTKQGRVEAVEEIPHDFDLLNTIEIYDRFLSKDIDYCAAQALDARQYLEDVIYMIKF
jgi:hypothetical protein